MINIREVYHSAGKKYSWPYRWPGVGIAREHFNGEGNLEITIGKEPTVYYISKSEALEVVNKYKSVFWVKGVKLGVVPVDLLKKLSTEEDCEILKLEI